MRVHSDRRQFEECLIVAADHNLVISEKAGGYSVFRKMPDRVVFLSRRGSVKGLRRVVFAAAGL